MARRLGWVGCLVVFGGLATACPDRSTTAAAPATTAGGSTNAMPATTGAETSGSSGESSSTGGDSVLCAEVVAALCSRCSTDEFEPFVDLCIGQLTPLFNCPVVEAAPEAAQTCLDALSAQSPGACCDAHLAAKEEGSVELDEPALPEGCALLGTAGPHLWTCPECDPPCDSCSMSACCSCPDQWSWCFIPTAPGPAPNPGSGSMDPSPGSGCKGPIAGATVTARPLLSEAPTSPWWARTGEAGGWSAPPPPALVEPAVYVSRGGTYVAEATGDTIEVGARTLEAIAVDGTVPYMTPLTTWHAALTRCLMEEQELDLYEAHARAKDEVARRFSAGFEPFDAARIAPQDPTAPSNVNGVTPEVWYGLLLAGVSQLGSEWTRAAEPDAHRLDGLDVTAAVLADASDPGCALDGSATGRGSAWQQLPAAMEAFLDGPRNTTGLTREDLAPWLHRLRAAR